MERAASKPGRLAVFDADGSTVGYVERHEDYRWAFDVWDSDGSHLGWVYVPSVNELCPFPSEGPEGKGFARIVEIAALLDMFLPANDDESA